MQDPVPQPVPSSDSEARISRLETQVQGLLQQLGRLQGGAPFFVEALESGRAAIPLRERRTDAGVGGELQTYHEGVDDYLSWWNGTQWVRVLASPAP